jgi:predicted aminopeptidase
LPPGDDADSRREDEFEQLVFDARERLRALYASSLPADAMRVRKSEEIDRMRKHYFHWSQTQCHGQGGHDGWIESEINNAKLLPFGLYRRWTPSFAALFARQEGNWQSFYDAVAKIARADPAARTEALARLQIDKTGP